MTRVNRYLTSDGVVHETYQKAERHAEARYGDAITRLAHTLVQIDKYKAMVEFLDKNLDTLAELKALHADVAYVQPEDEE